MRDLGVTQEPSSPLSPPKSLHSLPAAHQHCLRLGSSDAQLQGWRTPCALSLLGGTGLQGGTAGGKQWSAQFGISALRPPEKQRATLGNVRELGRGVCKVGSEECARVCGQGVIRIEGIGVRNCKTRGQTTCRRGGRVCLLGPEGLGGPGTGDGCTRGSQMHTEGTFAGADHLQHHLCSPLCAAAPAGTGDAASPSLFPAAEPGPHCRVNPGPPAQPLPSQPCPHAARVLDPATSPGSFLSSTVSSSVPWDLDL